MKPEKFDVEGISNKEFDKFVSELKKEFCYTFEKVFIDKLAKKYRGKKC